MPSVLVEVAYHDNEDDANWIVDNIDTIGRALAESIAEYFGVPFVSPIGSQVGTVIISSGSLNIRREPSLTSPIIARAYNGEKVQVLGEDGEWYKVNYGGRQGYAAKRYVKIYS
jgi:N-acetylmuramoyl-L-alanine amidase